MQRIAETRWYCASAELPLDARLEYAFRDSTGVEHLDPHNASRAEAFGEQRSVLRMPQYRESPWWTSNRAVLHGRVESHDWQDERSGAIWRGRVYLPASHAKGATYPLLIVNDGTIYVRDLELPRLLDRMIAAGALPALVAVFLDPNDRGADYRGRTSFVDFVTESLIPTIERDYHTRPERTARAILGSSRGALGALHVCAHSSASVGACGLLMPAVDDSPVLAHVAQRTSERLYAFVLGGRLDARFYGDHFRTVDALRAGGHDVEAHVRSIGHSPHAWKQAVPAFLIEFARRAR